MNEEFPSAVPEIPVTDLTRATVAERPLPSTCGDSGGGIAPSVLEALGSDTRSRMWMHVARFSTGRVDSRPPYALRSRSLTYGGACERTIDARCSTSGVSWRQALSPREV